MNLQRLFQPITGYVFACILILLLTGCGGGGGGSSASTNPNVSVGQTSGVVTADAGDIIGVRVTQGVNLDGSASSTVLSDPLTYAWAFTAIPDGSTAVLFNPNTVNPSFIPDVVGTYTVELVASAGGVSSQRAIAYVEATIDGNVTGIRVHTSFASQCADCHDGRFARVDPSFGWLDPIPPKSGNHAATSNTCQACHTTFGFDIIRNVDHREVFDRCSTCHNGVTAIGKSAAHVVTVSECDDCHNNTDGFLPLDANGNFDHTNVTRACATCHNGSIALGDPGTPRHFDQNLKPRTDCDSCHTTTTFKDAYPDHTDIKVTLNKRCDSCHNGFTATAQKVGHPDMVGVDSLVVDCDVCHGTTRFSLGGVFSHRLDPLSVLTCATCHTGNNSINSLGKTLTHLDTISDCGACHNTNTFLGATVNHEAPAVKAQRCDACHDGSVALATPVHTNHMPFAPEDCGACHTPGSFTTGTYDHLPMATACTTCHNGVISVGKLFNHLPTTEDCGACHTSISFAGAVFDHSGVTSNCAACHDGNISPGKSLNHLPVPVSPPRDCSDCHVIDQFTDFTGGTFDHVGIDANNCSACHNKVIAIGKDSNHIPAQTECSQCHTDTNIGGFAPSIFLGNVHPNLTGGCEGCHTSKFLPTRVDLLKGANHLPSAQDCNVCHTNTTPFNQSIFTHAEITGQCASCHDGSASNIAVGALGKTGNHPTTTADCGVCHGIGANFLDGIFDHTGIVNNCSSCHGLGAAGATVKKNPGHVVTQQDCSICHVPGTFTTAVFNHTGIVNNCASCHSGQVPTATIKPVSTHLVTTEDCSVCHNTTAFAGARFDHANINSSCATCHDGIIALGKDGNHVPTNKDCSVCHRTTGFIPGTFVHIGIVDNCQSCHNSALAIGKPINHVRTNLDCGVCHAVSNTRGGFLPATFDHSGVSTATRCDSCHGVTSTGLSPGHLTVPNNLDCRACHTTATFAGGTWVHDPITTANMCDSCHAPNSGATPKPGGHLSTTVQCDTCHSTTAWAPSNFRHDPNGNYPGDHRKNLTCSKCHGGNISATIPYPHIIYAPFCAACHANDFRSEGDHNGGKGGTVEQNKDCSNGGRGCHKVNDGGF